MCFLGPRNRLQFNPVPESAMFEGFCDVQQKLDPEITEVSHVTCESCETQVLNEVAFCDRYGWRKRGLTFVYWYSYMYLKEPR